MNNKEMVDYIESMISELVGEDIRGADMHEAEEITVSLDGAPTQAASENETLPIEAEGLPEEDFTVNEVDQAIYTTVDKEHLDFLYGVFGSMDEARLKALASDLENAAIGNSQIELTTETDKDRFLACLDKLAMDEEAEAEEVSNISSVLDEIFSTDLKEYIYLLPTNPNTIKRAFYGRFNDDLTEEDINKLCAAVDSAIGDGVLNADTINEVREAFLQNEFVAGLTEEQIELASQAIDDAVYDEEDLQDAFVRVIQAKLTEAVEEDNKILNSRNEIREVVGKLIALRSVSDIDADIVNYFQSLEETQEHIDAASTAFKTAAGPYITTDNVESVLTALFDAISGFTDEATRAEIKELVESGVSGNTYTVSRAKDDIIRSITEYTYANKIEAEEIETIKLAFKQAVGESLSLENLNVSIANFESIIAKVITAEQLNAAKATIREATIDTLYVNTLNAKLAIIEKAIIDTVDAKIVISEKTISDSVDAKIVNSEKTISDSVDAKIVNSEKTISDSVDAKIINSEKTISDSVDAKIINSEKTISDSVDAKIVTATQTISDSVDAKIVTAEQTISDSVDAKIVNAEQTISDSVDAKIVNAEQTISDSVDAKIVTAEQTISDSVDAKIVTAEQTISDSVDAKIVTAEQTISDSVDAKIVTAEQTISDSVDAKIVTAEQTISDSVDAKIANINIANIDFANIDLAQVEKIFSKAGVINDLTTETGTITGELVGVTISGDLIEANTLKADKLVVLGSDGLYYKLNVSGETVESQQTDYNSINGSHIQAKSITATKISVSDLVAFGATIGGLILENGSIHSVGKTLNNNASGIYMDSQGQFNTGDEQSFIKSYFDETDQKWKVKIQSDLLYLSTGRSISSAVDKVDELNQHFWFDTTGAHVQGETSGYRNDINSGGMEIVNPDDNSSVAKFNESGIRLGKESGESRVNIDYHSLKLTDKEGNQYLFISDLRNKNGEAIISEEIVVPKNKKQVPTSLSVHNVISAFNKETGEDITNMCDVQQQDHRFIYLGFTPETDFTLLLEYKTVDASAKAYTLGYRNPDSIIGPLSFSSGSNTTASGSFSHAEGFATTASGSLSHAEGASTTASGFNSHAEGSSTTASETFSHAEGANTTASGGSSHAEGYGTTASGGSSHAEGYGTTASGASSHAEGSKTIASKPNSHAEGSNTTASEMNSHAEGEKTTASASNSHAEGINTTASEACSHAEGSNTTASSYASHAEGFTTTASGGSSHAEGDKTIASGPDSHAEGYNTKAIGLYSHAEGNGTTANGENSHAEGNGTTASGYSSHAEGFTTTAEQGSHAEGHNTTATGYYSHAEGDGATASGLNSHAEGNGTTASGWAAHAEGYNTKAIGDYSHSQNFYTIASHKSQTAIGEYNIEDTGSTSVGVRGNYAVIVGNGTSEEARSNALTVDWNGNVNASGNVNATDVTASGSVNAATSVNVGGTNILELVYPVGSIYMSVNATDPGTLFGGTWTRIEDRFLLAAGSTYAAGGKDGQASVSYTPAGTVGNHTLQTSEIPAHTHGSKTLTGDAQIYSDMGMLGAKGSGTGIFSKGALVKNTAGPQWRTDYASYKLHVNATHTHDSVGGGGAHNHPFTGTAATIKTMPPYLTVYMWQRTA